MIDPRIRIRKITSDDWSSIQGMISRLFPTAFPSLDGDNIMVAEHGNNIIGFIHASTEKNRIIVHGVGIHQEYQGKGIGSMLLSNMLGDISDGYSNIYLKVSSTNLSAISLYARYGFTLKKFGTKLTLVRKENC